jgi:hypothetical protein
LILKHKSRILFLITQFRQIHKNTSKDCGHEW